MEFKTPYVWSEREALKLKSFCPNCDGLMTVELSDPGDLKSDLIQVCWQCGHKQQITE